MVDFACAVITPGASVHTDGARMFARLTDKGYDHHATAGSKSDGPDTVMPGPHLLSSLLKRWTAGTLHYRISRQHPCPTTSTSSPSGSIAGPPKRAGCCSTDCSSSQRNGVSAKGVCERWKIVPAVAEVFKPQPAHIHKPSPVRQECPSPHRGQENPAGQRSFPRYPTHAVSSGNQARNSW